MRLFDDYAWLLAATVALGASMLGGCTPQIGDSCVLSTDCASDGTRICDTAEYAGYCTILNCTGNNLGSPCPEYSICVLFNANVPGCPFSARTASRVGESQCRIGCNDNTDCRTGYLCANPSEAPWNAQILDPNQSAKVCMPSLGFIDGGIINQTYAYTGPADAVPPVCQATGPTFDAGFPPLDAAVDADAAPDAAPDAAKDAAAKDAASDAKVDSTVHDAGTDSGHDAGHDAGTDAPAKDGASDALPKDGATDVKPG